MFVVGLVRHFCSWAALVSIFALSWQPVVSGAMMTALIDLSSGGSFQAAGPANDPFGRTWNAYHTGVQGVNLFALKYTTGANAPYTAQVTSAFQGLNTNGVDGLTSPSGPTGDALARGYPGAATRDSAYVLSPTPSATLRLASLPAGGLFDLYLFASRMAVDGLNRNTVYTVISGSGTSSQTLTVTNNTGTVLHFVNLEPDAGGRMDIVVSRAVGNNSTFGYLGVVELVQVPEPSMLCAALFSMALGLRRFRPVWSRSRR